MKKSGFLVPISLAAILMAGSASAQTTYVGEICFLVGTGQEGDDEGAMLQLAFSDMGDDHYIVNGVELRDGGVPNSDSELYNGNAEIVGGSVMMMVHSSRNSEDETFSGKFNVQISLNTLDGTLNGTSMAYNKQTEESETVYIEGVIEVVACPAG